MSIYKLGTSLEKIKFTREAASVMRCHTITHHGEYSVGHHSFNMLTMLRILYPDAPVALIWAIIEHDIPERLTGDIPSPVKWFKIINKIELNKIECEINIAIFGEDLNTILEPHQIMWLAGLDILELFMWCKDQLMLGNENVLVMISRIDKFIKNNNDKFPIEIVNLYYETKLLPWRMCPDLGDEQ